MYQGIEYDIEAVMEEALDSELFNSLATVQQPCYRVEARTR